MGKNVDKVLDEAIVALQVFDGVVTRAKRVRDNYKLAWEKAITEHRPNHCFTCAVQLMTLSVLFGRDFVGDLTTEQNALLDEVIKTMGPMINGGSTNGCG